MLVWIGKSKHCGKPNPKLMLPKKANEIGYGLSWLYHMSPPVTFQSSSLSSSLFFCCSTSQCLDIRFLGWWIVILGLSEIPLSFNRHFPPDIFIVLDRWPILHSTKPLMGSPNSHHLMVQNPSIFSGETCPKLQICFEIHHQNLPTAWLDQQPGITRKWWREPTAWHVPQPFFWVDTPPSSSATTGTGPATRCSRRTAWRPVVRGAAARATRLGGEGPGRRARNYGRWSKPWDFHVENMGKHMMVMWTWANRMVLWILWEIRDDDLDIWMAGNGHMNGICIYIYIYVYKYYCT